jgi:hypothetical protein
MVFPFKLESAPQKAALPDDIQGLVDHQAISVTIAGFRNEMSGLVRDIRSIPGRRQWHRFGAPAAGLFLLLVVLVLAKFGIPLNIGHLFSHTSESLKSNNQWSDSTEWVAYATDSKLSAYYFKPSSVRTFGDRVVFAGRFPVKSSSATAPSEAMISQNAYEDDVTVVDCQKSIFALAEKTVYSKPGEVTYQFKWGEPETLDLSVGGPVPPNSIISIAKRLLCDEKLRTPLVTSDQLASMHLTHLPTTPNGDGNIFYGPRKTISNSTYPIELLEVIKFRQDHSLAELFPGQTIIGLTSSYRMLAQPLQLNCTDHKMQIPKFEYFDAQNHLVYVTVNMVDQPIDVKVNPFVSLLKAGCGVSGTYEGMNEAAYKKSGARGQQKISIIVEQNGDDVNVTFQTSNGGQGKGMGTLTGNTVSSISLQSTALECSGSYKGSLKFDGDVVDWVYQGEDCGGSMEGHGIAKRAK